MTDLAFVSFSVHWNEGKGLEGSQPLAVAV